MTPRVLIGTANIPDGDELRLFQRGGDFMIVLDRNELMSSRMSGSEIALATMTLDRLDRRTSLHLLIGGYGMGFTLRAALNGLDTSSQVTVAELVPEIIEWARGPMAELAAGCLDDPRVSLIEDDVIRVIADGRDTYDAILLDVDNGPDGVVRKGNNKLYNSRGLADAFYALKPGGILAIWSAAPDTAFTRRIKEAGYLVEERTVPARSNGKGAKHTIWFAKKP